MYIIYTFKTLKINITTTPCGTAPNIVTSVKTHGIFVWCSHQLSNTFRHSLKFYNLLYTKGVVSQLESAWRKHQSKDVRRGLSDYSQCSNFVDGGRGDVYWRAKCVNSLHVPCYIMFQTMTVHTNHFNGGVSDSWSRLEIQKENSRTNTPTERGLCTNNNVSGARMQ